MNRRTLGLCCTSLLVAFLLSAAPAAADAWRSDLALYLWATGVNGRVGVGNVESDVDISFSDILDDLQFGAMAGYAGTNGRFVVLADAVVANLGKTRRSQGGAVRTDVDVDLVILEGDFGYAVSDGFQLFGGVRWFSVTSKLDLRLGDLERRGRSDQDWVDPLVGFRVGTARGDRWSFWLRGDVGGFGVGSDLTWNAVAAFSYRINDRIGIGAGYRYMDIDYDDGSGNGRFLLDARMDGPVAGVVFSF